MIRLYSKFGLGWKKIFVSLSFQDESENASVKRDNRSFIDRLTVSKIAVLNRESDII